MPDESSKPCPACGVDANRMHAEIDTLNELLRSADARLKSALIDKNKWKRAYWDATHPKLPID